MNSKKKKKVLFWHFTSTAPVIPRTFQSYFISVHSVRTVSFNHRCKIQPEHLQLIYTNEGKSTYERLQHFLCIWINLNNLLIQSRDLRTKWTSAWNEGLTLQYWYPTYSGTKVENCEIWYHATNDTTTQANKGFTDHRNTRALYEEKPIQWIVLN